VALARDLRRIDGLGINLLIVFAAAEVGTGYLHTYGGEPLVALQTTGRLRIIDIDGGDHVFSARGARQCLNESVTAQLQAKYPRRPGHVSSSVGMAPGARTTQPGNSGPRDPDNGGRLGGDL
jgi:hypothetical protein